MPDARNKRLPGSIYPARPRIRRTQASGNAPREASEGGTRANRHERASSRRECAGSSVLAQIRLHSGSVYAPLKLATAVKSDSGLASHAGRANVNARALANYSTQSESHCVTCVKHARPCSCLWSGQREARHHPRVSIGRSIVGRGLLALARGRHSSCRRVWPLFPSAISFRVKLGRARSRGQGIRPLRRLGTLPPSTGRLVPRQLT